jgi:hypothetical protein
MLVITSPTPLPDPDRLRFLAEHIFMLEAPEPRLPLIRELVGILTPWTKHFAGGPDEARSRLRRLKALGLRKDGHLFRPEELEARIQAAFEILPPNVAVVRHR